MISYNYDCTLCEQEGLCIEPFCGDGMCNSDENSSNCPADCGEPIDPTIILDDMCSYSAANGLCDQYFYDAFYNFFENGGYEEYGDNIYSVFEYLHEVYGPYSDNLTVGDICSTCTNETTIGCTDPNACNYNADANDDDGSCEFSDENNCDCTGGITDPCGVCNGDGSSCGSFLQFGIDQTECGGTFIVPEGDYDEAITIHKCITIKAEPCDGDDCDGRAAGYKRVRVRSGTAIDFDESDNDDCECSFVTLEGIEFYGSTGQDVIKVDGGGNNSVSLLDIKNSIIDGEDEFARGVYIPSGPSDANYKIENTSFYNIGQNYIKMESAFSGAFDGTYNFFDQAESDGICNDCSEGSTDECTVFNGDMFSGVDVQTQIGPWYFEDPQENENPGLVVEDCEGDWGGSTVLGCDGTCATDCDVFNGTVPEIDECDVCGGSGPSGCDNVCGST